MESKLDLSTKDKIIKVAIEAFAKEGYEAASMRKIAERVGIKASSIYNHFKSKEQILLEIFKRYQSTFEADDIFIGFNTKSISIDEMIPCFAEKVEQFFTMLTQPEFMEIVRILFKEQLNNGMIKQFYLDEIIQKPQKELEHLLGELIKQGKIRENDVTYLAEEFFGYPIYLVYKECMLGELSTKRLLSLTKPINQHIENFWKYISLR